MADVSRVQAEILTDGDVLRGERLTRSLFHELSDVDGIEVQMAADCGTAESGAKGAEALADASIWVFLTAGAQAGARILLGAIHAWVEREKHRTVRLKVGDRSMEIPADITPGQERLVEAFLRGDQD